jgi:hypothetical protein
VHPSEGQPQKQVGLAFDGRLAVNAAGVGRINEKKMKMSSKNTMLAGRRRRQFRFSSKASD